MSTGAKVAIGVAVAAGVFFALGGTSKAAEGAGPKPCDVSDLPDVPAGAGLRSRVQKALPGATKADLPALQALLVEVSDLPGGCPTAAQTIAQKIADLKAATGSAGGGPTIDCAKMGTWPANVQKMWLAYEAHKAEAGASSAYAKSHEAEALRDAFSTLKCPGNAATVQKTIQRWIDEGVGMGAGAGCHDSTSWPAATKGQYDAYLADPRGYVDTGAGPALVAMLNDVHCTGAAAAVQHTIDLEATAGKVHADGTKIGGSAEAAAFGTFGGAFGAPGPKAGFTPPTGGG